MGRKPKAPVEVAVEEIEKKKRGDPKKKLKVNQKLKKVKNRQRNKVLNSNR